MTSPLEVLAINESNLDNSFIDGEISIPGYTIVTKDRNRYGGGGCSVCKRKSVLHNLRRSCACSTGDDLC